MAGEIDLNEMHAKLVALGEEWAEHKHASELLAESRKSVLAQIALQYREKAKSSKDAETMALADADYINHIKAMVESERKTNLARVKYDAARTWVDVMRTQEATKRAEMNLK